MAGQDPIHIKESRVGSFTATARAHSEGVQEYAHHILAHPGDHSEHLDKQAQFAENASHWHHG